MATERKEKMTPEEKKQISESEGFPVEQVERYVNMMGGQPYITGAGLQYKMITTYGMGGFSIQSIIPSRDEIKLLREMMGLKDEEPMMVMRGEVWIKGCERPFTDYGTATPKNLKGFVKFSDYPLEMANRRATNRAMRLATATGMCSIDEIKNPSGDVESGEQEHSSPFGNETLCTEGQKDLIKNLGRNPLLTNEERETLEGQVNNGLTKKQASEIIERLKTMLDARRKHPQAEQKNTTSEQLLVGPNGAARFRQYCVDNNIPIKHLQNSAKKHFNVEDLENLTVAQSKVLKHHFDRQYLDGDMEPSEICAENKEPAPEDFSDVVIKEPIQQGEQEPTVDFGELSGPDPSVSQQKPTGKAQWARIHFGLKTAINKADLPESELKECIAEWFGTPMKSEEHLEAVIGRLTAEQMEDLTDRLNSPVAGVTV